MLDRRDFLFYNTFNFIFKRLIEKSNDKKK